MWSIIRRRIRAVRPRSIPGLLALGLVVAMGCGLIPTANARTGEPGPQFFFDDAGIFRGTETPVPTETPTPPAPTPTPAACPKGDVNADGAITTSDARLAYRYALGIEIPTLDQLCRADVIVDGIVTPADAQCIFFEAMELPESCL